MLLFTKMDLHDLTQNKIFTPTSRKLQLLRIQTALQTYLRPAGNKLIEAHSHRSWGV